MRRLFFALGAMLVLIWSLIYGDASVQEWKRYQQAYYRMALLNARGEREKEWIRGQRLEIKQIQIQGLGRVDRCLTCHLGVENPGFSQAPEPFRSHSSILQSHPPEVFGCIICHGGQGRAVTLLAGHGEIEGWPARLFKEEYMQAACYGCHGFGALSPEAMAAVLKGQKLINQYKCLRCHQVRGEGGSEGPDLSTVGSRRDWVWIYAELLNPQAMSPGSTMPNFVLSRDEAKYITIFLLTLLDAREEVSNVAFLSRKTPQPSPSPTAGMEPQVQGTSLTGMEKIPT
ncbi:MAG: c-type cytochrome, partial [Anaerolineae bacterium]